jgi:hypothetical protein
MASWVSGAAQEYPFLTKVIVGATVGLIALKVTAITGAYIQCPLCRRYCAHSGRTQD